MTSRQMQIDIYGLYQLALADFIGSSVAVLGIKGSGKSNTAAVLMEECLQGGVPILVLDVTGEYYTLKEQWPSVTTIGHSRDPASLVDVAVGQTNAKDVARQAYKNASQVVFDLSGIARDDRQPLVATYLGAIWDMAPALRYPLVVFVEECHHFIPQRAATDAKPVLVDMAAEGRKWGISLVVIGQRSSRIDKDVLTQADLCFLHHVTHPADLKVYSEIVPRPRPWVRDKVSKLNVGQALVLRGRDVTAHQVRLRTSRHVGYTPTLDNLPVQRSLVDLMADKYD
jgi:uncharacterized protein